MVEKIIENLKELGYDAMATKVDKNGTILNGITIRTPGVNVAPTIYYENLTNGTIGEMCAQIIDIYEKNKMDEDMDMEWITKWDKVKERELVPFVRSNKFDKEGKYVLRPLLDMVVGVKILIDGIGDAQGAVTVTKQLLETWGITEDELFANANDNYTIRPMNEVMAEMMGMSVDELASIGMEMPESSMFVASNTSKINGAGILSKLDVIKDKANELEYDLFILPSSIHECLLVPDNGKMNLEELQNMVSEVNNTQVAPEDLLTYSVYKYTRETNKLTIAN